MTPRATVRLQLHAGFTFDDAAATVDHHARLGISHVYASPIFTARAGSTHGYDVTDPTEVNPELGGEAGLRRLVRALRDADMGLVIDIVPNHLGIASAANHYWQDVLKGGPNSRHAHWFDIDWNSPVAGLNGKVLLPVLGSPYEETLSAHELGLRFDAATGALFIGYHDTRFPLNAPGHADVLGSVAGLREALGATDLTLPGALDAAQKKLTGLASDEPVKTLLARALSRYQPGSAEGMAALHALLKTQYYKLSWWRNAAEEINWRRFFEVSDLAGLRVEHEDVFEATHALVFALYAQGLIDGVRIDHVDGLADPAGYCQRLRHRLAGLQAQRPPPLDAGAAWIVVEKILSPGEALPPDWRVDGSTGYDFMDQAGAVLHDPSGLTELGALWVELTGDTASFEDHVQQARQQLLAENFVGEFDMLARALHRHVLSQPPAGHDIALPALRRVLSALLAACRRYRGYATLAGATDEDRQVLQQAVDGARAGLHPPDHQLLTQVAQWLGLKALQPHESCDRAPWRAEALRRFQQLTPPLAAKSVEDTVFYRHAPLLSRNDVGSYPAQTVGVDAFHAANVLRARDVPQGLLATATHDHKRGEDTRARLAVLSEMPQTWGHLLRGWLQAHAPWRTLLPLPGGGLLTAPQPTDEVMLYQTLVGAWPPGLAPDDSPAVAAFAERVAAWQEKSLREAKQQSSWMLPDATYEAACRHFLMQLLCGEAHPDFLPKLAALVTQLTPAATANSLAQTLLRLTCPGVPDLYQGTDLADFSLVDPDNRRAVNWRAHRAALSAGWAGPWHQDLQLLGKQQLIGRALALRHQHPALFAGGEYLPLAVRGQRRAHVIAFERRRGDLRAVSIAPRLPATLSGPAAGSAPPTLDWGDTVVELPDALAQTWTDVLRDRPSPACETGFRLAEVLQHWPVALLMSDATAA